MQFLCPKWDITHIFNMFLERLFVYLYIFKRYNMNKVVLLLAFLFLSTIGFAQTRERSVTAIEVEPGIGLYRGYTTLSLEARYNFKSPWDIGLRESLENCFTDGGNALGTYDIVGDYNFKRGENLSLFVGAGIGLTTYDYYAHQISAYKRHTMFHFMPRVGVEIMNRVRVSTYLNTYGDKNESCGVGLSAGVVFGGSRMENKRWNIYHFEFEPFFGVSSGAILLGLEARYNFDKPWDVGVNFAGDFNGERITAVGDYNFLKRRRATLFGGLGAGWANTRILNIDEAIDKYGYAWAAPSSSCVCIYPRVGVELFEHLRLTAAVNTYNMKKAELAITIGVAIGGGGKE